MKRTTIVLALLLAASACPAAMLYDNTTAEQPYSVFFSSGFSEIGDQLTLRTFAYLQSVSTQFFNLGEDATFDATLTIYGDSGALGQFSANNLFIASFSSATITFSNLDNLQVPFTFVAALSIANVSPGGDLGLNLFDPPTVGSSSNAFFLANSGAGLVPASTLLNVDNLYFQVSGQEIPEPSSAALTLGALSALFLLRRRT